MTEPESSEVYSDLDKSAQESENSSHRKSISDYNTDTSAASMSKVYNPLFSKYY